MNEEILEEFKKLYERCKDAKKAPFSADLTQREPHECDLGKMCSEINPESMFICEFPFNKSCKKNYNDASCCKSGMGEDCEEQEHRELEWIPRYEANPKDGDNCWVIHEKYMRDAIEVKYSAQGDVYLFRQLEIYCRIPVECTHFIVIPELPEVES